MRNIDKKRLDALYMRLCKLKKTFLGYPCDAKFDYSPLYRFLEFPINNVGDPFEHSTYRLQTKEFEQEALSFFAKLYHLGKPHGYVTNGGTEGNLYGLFLGRSILGNVPVVFSQDTHYSIRKNVHILNLKSIVVKSLENGEINYGDFEKKIRRKKAVIICANIGTTMKGAIDNVEQLVRILKKNNVKFYIHADAALYGMTMPFVRGAKLFDFRTPISSLAVSGHKFIGSPIPCGVALARKDVFDAAKSYIEYIDAHDTTLSGSRDAFTPLILWYRIKTIGRKGFARQVKYSNDLAAYLEKKLKMMGWPNVARSYNTVYFKRPSKHSIYKWELAAQKDIAHVICLPHDSKPQIDEFLADLRKELK